jgi:4-azaleucine resistance transporter AzlC
MKAKAILHILRKEEDYERKNNYCVRCPFSALKPTVFGQINIKSHLYQFFLSLFNQSYWIMGCLLGNFIGTTIEFNSAGIEFAMTSIFVTVFVEQWKSTKNHIPAIIGVVATAICLAIFGSEDFLIPSMFVITVLLFALRKPLEKKEEVCNDD